MEFHDEPRTPARAHGHYPGGTGVVYGDLGTSPLYALKESFAGHLGLQPTPEGILSIVSLFFWTIMIVVSFKYVLLVLRADDKGEGGSSPSPRWLPAASPPSRAPCSCCSV